MMVPSGVNIKLSKPQISQKQSAPPATQQACAPLKGGSSSSLTSNSGAEPANESGELSLGSLRSARTPRTPRACRRRP
eukprot:582032-Prymnesium_polylepis.1